MNEILYRALLRAGLTEQDIVGRLEVDPKTVRRWLEGRLPQQRHRWALACMLGLDDGELWPQVRAARAARSRPEEIRAVYGSRASVPGGLWRSLFAAARRDAGVLDSSGLFLAEDAGVVAELAARASAGVAVRICLADPDQAGGTGVEGGGAVAEIRRALSLYGRLRRFGDVQIRLHQVLLYNSVYRADEEMLVSQHAYGIPVTRAPVLHLRGSKDDEMTAAYLTSFEQIWAGAVPH